MIKRVSDWEYLNGTRRVCTGHSSIAKGSEWAVVDYLLTSLSPSCRVQTVSRI